MFDRLLKQNMMNLLIGMVLAIVITFLLGKVGWLTLPSIAAAGVFGFVAFLLTVVLIDVLGDLAKMLTGFLGNLQWLGLLVLYVLMAWFGSMVALWFIGLMPTLTVSFALPFAPWVYSVILVVLHAATHTEHVNEILPV